MPLPKESIYTSDDYWNLPEGEHAELIDGQLYNMAPPSLIHQTILFNLGRKIADYIDVQKGDCKVLPAPFAVNLTGNDKTWVEPDLSVICDKSKLSDRGCEGAPDWIIEIVSPSTQQHDYGIKLFKYRTSGVREYWIVNPATQTVNVYDFEQSAFTAQYTFAESIPVGLYPGFFICISDLIK